MIFADVMKLLLFSVLLAIVPCAAVASCSLVKFSSILTERRGNIHAMCMVDILKNPQAQQYKFTERVGNTLSLRHGLFSFSLFLLVYPPYSVYIFFFFFLCFFHQCDGVLHIHCVLLIFVVCMAFLAEKYWRIDAYQSRCDIPRRKTLIHFQTY